MTETLNSLQSLKYLRSGHLWENFAYPNSEGQGRVSSHSDVRAVLPKDNPDTSKMLGSQFKICLLPPESLMALEPVL